MLPATTFRPFLRQTCAAALVLAAGVLTPARDAHAKHHQHSTGAAYHVIRSVDEKAKTVTVGTENNKDVSLRVLKVTVFTEITVDGQKATLHDLQPGMKVELDVESDNEAKELEASHVDKK